MAMVWSTIVTLWPVVAATCKVNYKGTYIKQHCVFFKFCFKIKEGKGRQQNSNFHIRSINDNDIDDL